MRWLLERGYTTAITPHGFHVYLIPSRPLLIRQAERELEPFVKRVFADFPWQSAGLKPDRCSWSRLNGERISPIILWRPETVVRVPHDLPRILYGLRSHRVGISVAGVVTPWRAFQRKSGLKADAGAGLSPVATPIPTPTLGLATPMLGDRCGHMPTTSAEKHEACSKALGMRARYLSWGLLDERTQGDSDFVWQEMDPFVTGVSDAVGLPPDEIADIFNRFAPESGKARPDLWGKLNVPCRRIYCGQNLPIRSPQGAKQHYAEFARSIYIFPFHGFSLAQTLSVSRRYFDLLSKSGPSKSAFQLALANEAKDDEFRAIGLALQNHEPDLAEGLASLLNDTAVLLGGQEPLFRWLDTDCPRLCRKFWSGPWTNSCEVSRAEMEKVLLAVRKLCAHNPNYQFSTAEITRQAGITATPRPEKWLAVAQSARAAKGQKLPVDRKSPAERQVDSAHHKTQVALKLLGCSIAATGLKNPNRPGCKAKRQAPAAILSLAWIVPGSELPPSLTHPPTSLCPSNSHKNLPLALREVDLVDGLGEILPPLQVAKLSDAIWRLSSDEVCERLAQADPQWDFIVRHLNKAKSSLYLDSLPPALRALRECLGADGNVYHPKAQAEALVQALIDRDKRCQAKLVAELMEAGLVVDTTRLSGGSELTVAWRRNIEGEAAFACSVARLSRNGGQAEVVFGEPGTGKTEWMASRIAQEFKTGQKMYVGSAQNNSARSLEDRILAKYNINQPVLSVHKAFCVPVDAEQFRRRQSRADSAFADEFGQLDAFTAGAMAARWQAGQRITLSVGPHQLLPVGPGCVGEDLIACLLQRPLPGWHLTELTQNHRAAGSQAIVDFFRGIRLGEVRKSGPELELIPVADDISSEDFLAHAVKVAIVQRQDIRNDAEPVTCFVPFDEKGAILGATYYRSALNRQPGFNAGELVIIREKDYATGARRFPRGAVAKVVANDPDGMVRVQLVPQHAGQQAIFASFRKEHLRSAFCRTVHAAQGFEVDFGVVVVIPSQITDRRWLYTAVSRCRKRCIIIYRKSDQRDDLADCIAKIPSRRTLLPRLFQHYADGHFAGI